MLATCNRLEIYADGRPLPRQRRGRSPRLLGEPRRRARRGRCCRTSTSTTTTAPSPTCSRSPPASTRWRRRGPDPRPDPRGAARRPGARHRRPGPQHAVPAGAARRQARPRRDRHRPGRPVPGRRRPRPRGRTSARSRARGSLVVGAGAMAGARRRRPSSARGAAEVVVVNRTAGARRAPRRASTPRTALPLGDARRRARRGRRRRLLHRRHRRRWSTADAVAARAPRRPARWPWSTWRCRTTSTRRVADLPGVTPGRPRRPRRRAARRPRPAREVDGGPHDRRRGGRAPSSPPAARPSVTPTVVALRTMATGVVDAELERLDAPAARPRRRPPAPRSLHDRAPGRRQAAPPADRAGQGARPTTTGAMSYAAALAELFALDPEAVDAVTRVGGSSHEHGRRTSAAPPRHPRLRAGHAPSPGWVADCLARAPRPRGRAGRGHHRGRPSAPRRWPSSAAPASSSAPCARRCSTARSTSPCTRSRTCRPRPADGIALAAVPAARGPARRRRRPRRPHPRRAARPAAGVGTGSPRRAAQLHALGLGLEIVGIRGNVDTRIGKVRDGELDAVVLARAGLARLGRLDEATEVLDPLQMLPAPGQGALAVECRADDTDLVDELRRARRPAHPRRGRPPSAPCWPRSRPAARPRSGALAEVVEGERRRRALGAGRGALTRRRRWRCGCPPPATRPTPPASAAASPSEMLDEGAATC